MYRNRFFLSIHDRVCCLLAAAILLPMSLFVVATTIRQVSLVDGGSSEDIYIISTKSASAAICIITAVLSIFITVACPYRRISFANMILSTLSAFGVMMSLATIFFKANWGGHHEALNKVIFIIVCSLCLVCSVSITIRIALRFKVQIGVVSEEDQLSNFLEQCSVILATLLIIASFTSICGFVIGYIIKYQLLLDKIFGGGLHSGIMGLLTSLVFLAGIYGGPRSRFSLLSISMGVSILALISAAVTYYTEEIEIDHSVEYITKNRLVFYPNFHYRKLLLMTKSTLILISSIFCLVFGTPLTVSTCCLLKKDLLLQPAKVVVPDKNEYDIEVIYGTYNSNNNQLLQQHSNIEVMSTSGQSYGALCQLNSDSSTKVVKSPLLGHHQYMISPPQRCYSSGDNRQDTVTLAVMTPSTQHRVYSPVLSHPRATPTIATVTGAGIGHGGGSGGAITFAGDKDDVCDLLKELVQRQPSM